MALLPGAPSTRAFLHLVTFGCVSLACGETTHSTESNSSDGGSGGTGPSTVGGPGSSGAGGLTAVAVGSSGPSTTGVAGNGGFSSTSDSDGFSTTGTTGGVGGNPNCGSAELQLEACYDFGINQGGAAGADADPVASPECWRDFASDCEGSFEGQVVRFGTSGDAEACATTLFGRPPSFGGDGPHWLILAQAGVRMRVALGRPADELDVEIGDFVEVRMLYRQYHDEFMAGNRLTLTKDGELLAVLNDNLPIDEPTSIGDLILSRGAEVCQEAEDSFTCTYVAHNLEVQRDDEALAVPPNSSSRFGPYDIVTDDNFDVRDGGGCDTGDTSDFMILRLKP